MEHKEIAAVWGWTAGRKESGYLPIIGGGAELPVTVLCGREPGPNILISAGVHCAEYVGIQAAVELAVELNLDVLRGTVAIFHLMCPTGFAHRTMSVVYEDGKNLNRVFPGSRTGTLADRTAYTVSEFIFRNADIYIDLHSGDGFEELTPFVYCQGAAEPSVAEISRELAELVDVPYLVPSQIAAGGAYNYAGSLGVPGILIERGCGGRWTRDEVEADKKDVRRILRHLGVLPGKPKACMPKEVLDNVIYENSDSTGFWYPFKKAGDRIIRGETLGEVRDCFGNLLQACRAQLDGVLLYQVNSLNIIENGPMAAYGGTSK